MDGATQVTVTGVRAMFTDINGANPQYFNNSGITTVPVLYRSDVSNPVFTWAALSHDILVEVEAGAQPLNTNLTSVLTWAFFPAVP